MAIQKTVLDNVQSILTANVAIVAAIKALDSDDNVAAHIQQQTKLGLHSTQNFGNAPLYLIEAVSEERDPLFSGTENMVNFIFKITILTRNFSPANIDDLDELYDHEELVIEALKAVPNLNTPTPIELLNTWTYSSTFDIQEQHATATLTFDTQIIVNESES